VSPVWLAWCAFLSAEPRDVAPQALAFPSWRVHAFVVEDVDPDALASLARPGVVLWLKTRSNMLRASQVARLGRFSESYVQLHSPILEGQVRQLEAAPRAGVWLDEAALADRGLFRLGARRRAVSIDGELTAERLAALVQARPARVLWRPTQAPRLDEWARFAQAPGVRVLVWAGPLDAADGGCPLARPPEGLTLWADSPRLGAPARLAAACGLALWVQVPPQVGDAWLQALFAANPKTELQVDVPDEGRVRSARALLEQLSR
jgi:hypothetical protein